MQAKWHPMTHAIYNSNLDLIKYLFAESKANRKKAIKVPGLFSTNEVNKLFPFYVALSSSNEEMFNYFWNEQRQLQWTEDSFDGLFKLIAKREASHFITPLLQSQTTLSLFLAMSFSYRFTFMERILATQGEILDEINQMLQQYTQEQSQSSSYKEGFGLGQPRRIVHSLKNSVARVSAGSGEQLEEIKSETNISRAGNEKRFKPQKSALIPG